MLGASFVPFFFAKHVDSMVLSCLKAIAWAVLLCSAVSVEWLWRSGTYWRIRRNVRRLTLLWVERVGPRTKQVLDDFSRIFFGDTTVER